MMKCPCAILTLTLLALLVLGCASAIPSQRDHLIFQPDVFHEATDEFIISPKIRNAGERASAALPNANARMELRDEHNILRASVEVVSLASIEAGSLLDPAVWRGRLDPGTYRVFWGAPGKGHSVAEFVVDQQDGRPQLGEKRIMPYPDQDMPVLPVYGDAQPLVDLAIEQLAEQSNVKVDLIRVERVEPVDFPDASLGAPQPDQMYAQVITPGYVIELSYQGLPVVFHGSGQQVVPSPDSPAETP
jgi:hypothetical protein